MTPGATDIELLTPIHKDIRRSEIAPPTVEQILKEVRETARELHEMRGKKPIYYLVSQNFLELLLEKPWFAEIENKLAGVLQFICCDLDARPQDQDPSLEDQGSLLEKLAIILRFKLPKRA